MGTQFTFNDLFAFHLLLLQILHYKWLIIFFLSMKREKLYKRGEFLMAFLMINDSLI